MHLRRESGSVRACLPPNMGSCTDGAVANRLVVQGDGNLVLYNGGTAKWSSRINGNGSSIADLQSAGKFVVYRYSDGKGAWSTGTNDKS